MLFWRRVSSILGSPFFELFWSMQLYGHILGQTARIRCLIQGTISTRIRWAGTLSQQSCQKRDHPGPILLAVYHAQGNQSYLWIKLPFLGFSVTSALCQSDSTQNACDTSFSAIREGRTISPRYTWANWLFIGDNNRFIVCRIVPVVWPSANDTLESLKSSWPDMKAFYCDQGSRSPTSKSLRFVCNVEYISAVPKWYMHSFPLGFGRCLVRWRHVTSCNRWKT